MFFPEIQGFSPYFNRSFSKLKNLVFISQEFYYKIFTNFHKIIILMKKAP